VIFVIDQSKFQVYNLTFYALRITFHIPPSKAF